MRDELTRWRELVARLDDWRLSNRNGLGSRNGLARHDFVGEDLFGQATAAAGLLFCHLVVAWVEVLLAFLQALLEERRVPTRSAETTHRLRELCLQLLLFHLLDFWCILLKFSEHFWLNSANIQAVSTTHFNWCFGLGGRLGNVLGVRNVHVLFGAHSETVKYCQMNQIRRKNQFVSKNLQTLLTFTKNREKNGDEMIRVSQPWVAFMRNIVDYSNSPLNQLEITLEPCRCPIKYFVVEKFFWGTRNSVKSKFLRGER